MSETSRIVEVISPPEEIESGEVVRVICMGDVCTRQRWAAGKWIPFPELTNAEMWYARRLSEDELRERGIKD
jgi:hypothetical protein